MIKIWRLENKAGIGCYRALSIEGLKKEIGEFGILFLTMLLYRHDKTYEEHPTPSCDFGIERDIYPEEICGFLNKEQGEKWFNKNELEDLEKIGFKLKEIEVKKITAIGRNQVLAIK